MGRVILCQNAASITPYYLAPIGKNIYSMEELCYFFRKNSFILDRDCMTEEIVDWISDNFGLDELTRVLRYQIRNNSALADYVAVILRNTGLYSEAVNDEIVTAVRENAKLDANEKRKVRADYLANNGLYMAAINEYESILNSEDKKDHVLTGALYNNIGFCYAKMFLFGNAAEYFEKAFKQNGKTTCLLQYMAALKLHMPEAEYRDLMLKKLECVNLSPELDDRLKQSMDKWEEDLLCLQLRELRDCGVSDNQEAYHRRQDEAINRLREEFRKSENELI